MKNNKQIKYLINSSVIIVGAVLVTVLLNAVLVAFDSKIPLKVSLTRDEIYELTDETKEIVLNGTYISDSDRALYQSFTFKGNSTVVIKDGIFGFDFATSYEKDGNLICIKTDQSDLLLEIVTPDSLVGEGFAKGSFKKVYK